VADYGLQITNASNTCVAWQVSMWHDTGWYYNNFDSCYYRVSF